MKKYKRTIVVTLILVMILSIVVPVSAANTWTRRQQFAHDVAEKARELGFGEDAAIIKIAQDIYTAEDGKSITGSYYYSSRTGKSYSVSGNVVYNEDGSVWDGTNKWYYNKSGDYYYYYNASGSKVRGTPNWGYTPDPNPQPVNPDPNPQPVNPDPAPTPSSKNLSGYDYAYKGVNLYAGRILNAQSYVKASDAEYLARFILSIAQNYDLKEWAATGWLVLNIKGDRSFAEIVKYVPHYNANIDLTTSKGKDALNLAYEILFRKQAEDAGNTYVGRILPKDYCYYWIEGGKLYFRANTNGSNYDFPDYSSTKKSVLHSPYK